VIGVTDRKRLLGASLFVLAAVVTLVSLFPIYWMFVSSLRPQADLFGSKVELFPRRISLEQYQYAFKAKPLVRIMFNTLFVSASRTLFSLFLCSLAGFAFAKLRFPGNRVLFLILLFTMLIPFEAMIIPSFIIVVQLGWLNTYYPLIVPAAASAFGIFFLRQYIKTIPDELVDAARIDGCGYFGIYHRVMLPTIKPALVTLAIFVFKVAWDDFLWPLIVIRKEIMQVMMVAIRTLPPLAEGDRNVPWGAIMAASSLSVLPLMVLFLVLQREFMSGATTGAIK
jgi:multiple sugar transport system permease protein